MLIQNKFVSNSKFHATWNYSSMKLTLGFVTLKKPKCVNRVSRKKLWPLEILVYFCPVIVLILRCFTSTKITHTCTKGCSIRSTFKMWSLLSRMHINQQWFQVSIVVLPCILISTNPFFPTNALFIKHKMLQFVLKIYLYMAPTCFGPSWTIIREHTMEPC